MTTPKTRTIDTDDHGYPKVDEIEVRSLKFPVYFGEGALRAYVTSEDSGYPLAVTAKTIEDLRSLLTRHTASQSGKISVPFWRFENDVSDSYNNPERHRRVGANPRMERIFIRGVHASTGHVLVRKDGEKKTTQWSGWNGRSGNYRGDMPESLRNSLIQTFIDEQDAIDRRVAIAKEWEIDLVKEAQDAVRQIVS